MSTQKPKLTKSEKMCHRAYRDARKLVGMNPTAEEVGQQMGLTRFWTARLLKNLVAKGVLVQNGQKARCYGLPKRTA